MPRPNRGALLFCQGYKKVIKKPACQQAGISKNNDSEMSSLIYSLSYMDENCLYNLFCLYDISHPALFVVSATPQLLSFPFVPSLFPEGMPMAQSLQSRINLISILYRSCINLISIFSISSISSIRHLADGIPACRFTCRRHGRQGGIYFNQSTSIPNILIRIVHKFIHIVNIFSIFFFLNIPDQLSCL